MYLQVLKRQAKYQINIKIDRLTNSIQNTFSGDSFSTDIHLTKKEDLKTVTKKNGWLFSWQSEFRLKDRQVYKLTIRDNPNIIQGLASISDFKDHYYLHLVESAPFNLGRNKIYEGFPGTCLLMPVNFPGIPDIKVLLPSTQKRGLFRIMKNH